MTPRASYRDLHPEPQELERHRTLKDPGRKWDFGSRQKLKYYFIYYFQIVNTIGFEKPKTGLEFVEYYKLTALRVASRATYSTSTDPPHEVPLLEGLPHEIKREYGTLYISYV